LSQWQSKIATCRSILNPATSTKPKNRQTLILDAFHQKIKGESPEEPQFWVGGNLGWNFGTMKAQLSLGF
jgi:hypothetical protein